MSRCRLQAAKSDRGGQATSQQACQQAGRPVPSCNSLVQSLRLSNQGHNKGMSCRSGTVNVSGQSSILPASDPTTAKGQTHCIQLCNRSAGEHGHCSADPLTRLDSVPQGGAPPALGSRLPPAKVTGTGDQRRPTDDDLIRTYDVTVAAWCNRSAQLGGCADRPR